MHAQRLLETTNQDVDTIAHSCGFGNAASLRHHFNQRLGTTPTRYRRTFAGTGGASQSVMSSVPAAVGDLGHGCDGAVELVVGDEVVR
ncbi:MAG: helix-turn-helix domain-containing protein [Pseudonocardiaceae bacterium]|nr:helix-turn-helix domain-containing protein [Pseudonocardiaceae bacterium]